MNTVDKIMSVATDEVGYLEKRTNAYLDDKTANAGYNNWTKYGRDLVSWVGSPFGNACAWCQMWVQWCFVKAYGLSEAKKLLGGWTAYCPTAVAFFKNVGRWYTSPKIGDQIFFKDATGTPCHTGIVYAVDTLYVYTIEGNTSGASGVVANGGGVFKKSYLRVNSRIAGYGRPVYDETKKERYTKKLPVLTKSRPSLKKGMKNIQVQRLQKFLNWYFDNKVVNNMSLDTDKVFGEMTRQGLIRFQKEVFPNDKSQWDGEFGSKSLAKAKTVMK